MDKSIKWLIIIICTVILLLNACAKKCECMQYNQDNEPTGEVLEREMPRSLKFDCSFFETRLDTLWIYHCE